MIKSRRFDLFPQAFESNAVEIGFLNKPGDCIGFLSLIEREQAKNIKSRTCLCDPLA